MHKYYITDVFTEAPYGGNQLATVLDAADIETSEMQQIARAFNFAETTFITGGDLASGYDVRIFTPEAELPFADHPTLGTSYLLRNVIHELDASELILNLGVGKIPVTFLPDGVLWMRQNSPVFGRTVSKSDVAASLGLSEDDLHPDYPAQFVSTGLEFLMVPLTGYDALKKARVVDSRLSRTFFVFCEGGYEADQGIQARMFAGDLGVSEDPATGSANGCLASYLCKHQMLGSTDVDVRVGQGYEINRPSQLYLKAQPDGDEILVDVGGRVRLVAEGTWLL